MLFTAKKINLRDKYSLRLKDSTIKIQVTSFYAVGAYLERSANNEIAQKNCR